MSIAGRLAIPMMFAAGLALLCGCSGNSNSTAATATDSPSPAASATPQATSMPAAAPVKLNLASGLSLDKRTGLPAYAGSSDFGSHMDSADWKLSTFTTADDPKKVIAWYKRALPSSFTFSSTLNDWKLLLLKPGGDGPAYDVDVQRFGPSGSEISLEHHP